jgi:alkylation response protein AidB-like acyl-CoA dehydrogenase
MRFVLNELHQDDGFGGLPVHEEFTQDLTDAVLEEAAKLCQDVLLPINLSGDAEGAAMKMAWSPPQGLQEAYDQFVQSGWGGLVMPVEYGGQGLPEAVGKLVEEMICATNVPSASIPA